MVARPRERKNCLLIKCTKSVNHFGQSWNFCTKSVWGRGETNSATLYRFRDNCLESVDFKLFFQHKLSTPTFGASNQIVIVRTITTSCVRTKIIEYGNVKQLDLISGAIFWRLRKMLLMGVSWEVRKFATNYHAISMLEVRSWKQSTAASSLERTISDEYSSGPNSEADPQQATVWWNP